jgi:hypothetical protein
MTSHLLEHRLVFADLLLRSLSHMDILKVAFTGSTLVGRQVMKAAAASNLKVRSRLSSPIPTDFSLSC